jgi:Ca2+-binding RTX toxin-like protein
MTTWYAPLSTTVPVDLAGPGITGLFVGPSVTISTQSNAVIASGGTTSSIIDIWGTVVSFRSLGLTITDADITLHAGAFLRGFGGDAISMGDGSVSNAGDIYCEGFNNATATAVSMFLNGFLNGSSVNSSIANSGKIVSGSGDGIHVYDNAGMTFTLTNTGLIQGKSGFRSFFGDDGNESVTNRGRMVGDINLFTGNDSYTGTSGHVIGKVFGHTGTDSIYGGTDNDWFEGGADGDTLVGGPGADTLIGDGSLGGPAGSDKLYGGIGIDKLTGGLGNDYFVFNAPNAAANCDVITDFTNLVGNNDTFWMENAIYTALGAGAAHALNPGFFWAGPAAHDANDYLVYNQANGYLSYDVNGNGAGGATVVAVLTNHPVLTASDFTVV